MKFCGKTLLALVASFYIGLGAAATEAETFLAENPDVQVGREALAKAEAGSGPNTFGVVNKPVGNIVMLQEFDADTNERIFAVALIDDEKAEKYYKENNKNGDVNKDGDGDVQGQIMKRYDTSSADDNKLRFNFERARKGKGKSRCGQYCSNKKDCTDPKCPSCLSVGDKTFKRKCQAGTL